jgi:hypothetical protein
MIWFKYKHICDEDEELDIFILYIYIYSPWEAC